MDEIVSDFQLRKALPGGSDASRAQRPLTRFGGVIADIDPDPAGACFPLAGIGTVVSPPLLAQSQAETLHSRSPGLQRSSLGQQKRASGSERKPLIHPDNSPDTPTVKRYIETIEFE